MADLLHGHPQEYFDSLEVPSLAKIEEIARKQEEKEREVEKKYHEPTEEQKARAAGTIQVGCTLSRNLCAGLILALEVISWIPC